MYLIAASAAFLTTSLLTYLLCRRPAVFAMLDQPNERSLHTVPVPRTGGLAMLAGIVIGSVLSGVLEYDPTMIWIGAATVMVASISLLDDRYGIAPGIRLGIHVLAALVLLGNDLSVSALHLPDTVVALPAWISVVVTLLLIVWMINLYNFMDGIDGFAGGMAVIGFGALACIGFMAGDTQYGGVCLSISLAAAGFLVFNFPPARIFMGDSGSSTLGLLAASLALWADRISLFPLWLSVLIFSPFVVDASVTLLRRLYRRDKIWMPHKSHYYQRLVQLGWGHRKTTLLGYSLMTLCALSALIAFYTPAVFQWAIIGSWIVVYTVLGYLVERMQKAVDE